MADEIFPLPESARREEVTEDGIALLVDSFYARARHDPLLGPVFARAIADEAWPAHLERMRRFWSSVMLTSGRYKGDPVGAHRPHGTLDQAMFARWLSLFGATAEAIFAPAPAALFRQKAERIAESLRIALSFRPGEGLPPDLRRRPPSERPLSEENVRCA